MDFFFLATELSDSNSYIHFTNFLHSDAFFSLLLILLYLCILFFCVCLSSLGRQNMHHRTHSDDFCAPEAHRLAHLFLHWMQTNHQLTDSCNILPEEQPLKILFTRLNRRYPPTLHNKWLLIGRQKHLL